MTKVWKCDENVIKVWKCYESVKNVWKCDESVKKLWKCDKSYESAMKVWQKLWKCDESVTKAMKVRWKCAEFVQKSSRMCESVCLKVCVLKFRESAIKVCKMALKCMKVCMWKCLSESAMKVWKCDESAMRVRKCWPLKVVFNITQTVAVSGRVSEVKVIVISVPGGCLSTVDPLSPNLTPTKFWKCPYLGFRIMISNFHLSLMMYRRH